MTRAKYKAIFLVCFLAVYFSFEAVIYFYGTNNGEYQSASIWKLNIIGTAAIMLITFIADLLLEKKLFGKRDE